MSEKFYNMIMDKFSELTPISLIDSGISWHFTILIIALLLYDLYIISSIGAILREQKDRDCEVIRRKRAALRGFSDVLLTGDFSDVSKFLTEDSRRVSLLLATIKEVDKSIFYDDLYRELEKNFLLYISNHGNQDPYYPRLFTEFITSESCLSIQDLIISYLNNF